VIADFGKEAKTARQFQQSLDKWVQENKGNTNLSDILIRPQIQADLAGQLMVDVHETGKVELSWHRDNLIVLQDEIPAFLNLRWDEAIEAYNQLEQGGAIPREREFVRIVDQYNFRSQKARQLLLDYLRKRSLELANQALDEGTTLREYMADIENFASGLGISIDNPAYLDNVFRTNLQTAYSAGRWRAMTDPDVIEARPYWRYQATMDADTCDFCRFMNGMIFEVGNPETDILVPPCHYQSRSAAVTHRLQQGEKVLKSPPKGYQNQHGFIADFAKAPLDLLRI